MRQLWLKPLQWLIRRRTPLGVAGVAIILLYLVYRLILEQAEFGPIASGDTVALLRTIINFTFIVAITAVVLSTVSFTLPRLLPERLLTPLPKVEYGIAVLEMFDPVQQGGTAPIMDRIEPYPGFPYYSRESDHPDFWPSRVWDDRQRLTSLYAEFFSDQDLRERLKQNPQFDSEGSRVELVGGDPRDEQRGLMNLITNLRNFAHFTLGGDLNALAEAIGPEHVQRFVELEQARENLHQDFPNRIAILRLKNASKQNLLDLLIEIEIHGPVYATKISADEEQVKHTHYDVGSQRITISELFPNYMVEIRIWYSYLPVGRRVFPDERHFIVELSQGVIVNNISVSEGAVRFNKELIEDIAGYNLLYAGSAEKKDDYSKELEAYFAKSAEQAEEHWREYELDHPTLENLDFDSLARSDIPDSNVTSIWIGFQSKTSKSYHAVHVFSHPKGPYVLLASVDRDREDFHQVGARLTEAFNGSLDGEITDRTDDISQTINVSEGFTQAGIAETYQGALREDCLNAAVEKLHYDRVTDSN